MSPMIEDGPITAREDSFRLIQHGHRDMVSAVAFNSYGDRFASTSVDGKIKVYNRHRDGSWNVCDTWGAHNAEILQVQWLPPTLHPNLLASISTDGKFKLWVEDPTLAPLKGRRFALHSNRPVYELRSPSRAPFTSFSVIHNPSTRHTHLALINRAAVLTVYENDEPENLENWQEVDRVIVCEKPARGEETSFKVCFDPNLEPAFTAIRQGVPRDALGLVVACMNRVQIWRTKEISHNVSLGSSSSKEFYLAAECKGHRGLARDVVWAKGNMRGFDVVATACKDGFVRVFNISTPTKSRSGRRLRDRDFAKAPENVIVQQKSAENGARNTPSGIGAELASARPGLNSRRSGIEREGEVMHESKEVGRLSVDGGRTPVWQVNFDEDGQLLGSVGDDGKLCMWRRLPSGIWSKSAEMAMTRTAIG